MDVRTVADLSPAERHAFFERDAGVEAVRDDVSEIVDRVRVEGDVALREFSEEFDGVAVGNIDITDFPHRAHGSPPFPLTPAGGSPSRRGRRARPARPAARRR